MVTIAKVKHPGSTKSAIRNEAITVLALKFGGRINGMAKWKTPNPRINNASKVASFKGFILLASPTFFSANNLKIMC
jgi:hypothetical protein